MIKRMWRAAIRNIGKTLHHSYAGNKLVGCAYMVRVGMRLDRERDREVFLILTPHEARTLAAQLHTYADDVDAENMSAGFVA